MLHMESSKFHTELGLADVDVGIAKKNIFVSYLSVGNSRFEEQVFKISDEGTRSQTM